MAEYSASAPNSSAMDIPVPARSHTHFLIAGLLSAFVPGTGHFVIKHAKRGLAFLAIFAVLCLLYVGLRLPQTVLGLFLAFFAFFILSTVSSLDALFPGRANPSKPASGWIFLLLPAALLATSIHNNWAMRATGFRLFSIPSRSMAPTLPERSRFIVDRRYYRHVTPHRGDIVLFVSPLEPGLLLIKRVIADPGDTIEVRNSTVLLNGQVVAEPYLLQDKVPTYSPHVRPLVLPLGKFFVMGDNRSASLDSREFGPIDISAIRGKVLYGIPGDGIPLRNSLKKFESEPQ